MRIQIESTDTLIAVNGARCRVWDGVTEGGHCCHVFVAAIGADEPGARAELRSSLVEQAPPPAFVPAEGLDGAEVAGLAAAVRGGRPVELSLDVAAAVELVAVLQLASRHPAARGSPVIRRVVALGRRLHEALERESPELGRLLERGWHPVWDVPRGG